MYVPWKVQAGDNILLRSVSNERYLSAQLPHQQSVDSATAKVSDVMSFMLYCSPVSGDY